MTHDLGTDLDQLLPECRQPPVLDLLRQRQCLVWITCGSMMHVGPTTAFRSGSGPWARHRRSAVSGRRLPFASIAKAIDCVTATKGWSRPKISVHGRGRERRNSDPRVQAPEVQGRQNTEASPELAVRSSSLAVSLTGVCPGRTWSCLQPFGDRAGFANLLSVLFGGGLKCLIPVIAGVRPFPGGSHEVVEID
jgi:hypothetical protein